jgi:hypothetical protein
VVGAAVAAFASPSANAALVLSNAAGNCGNNCEGITYQLTETSVSGLMASFELVISGQNTASDTIGGRTGINAFAFTNPTGGISAATVTAPPNFTFVAGGLNSTGCDGNGNFFCFDNTTIPPTPTTLAGSPITIDFTATLNAGGTWAGYAPAFKIDWVGTQNNYNLVSQDIPVNTGGTPPPPPPPPAPEPASLAIFGMGLLGLGMTQLRRKRS